VPPNTSRSSSLTRSAARSSSACPRQKPARSASRVVLLPVSRHWSLYRLPRLLHSSSSSSSRHRRRQLHPTSSSSISWATLPPPSLWPHPHPRPTTSCRFLADPVRQLLHRLSTTSPLTRSPTCWAAAFLRLLLLLLCRLRTPRHLLWPAQVAPPRLLDTRRTASRSSSPSKRTLQTLKYLDCLLLFFLLLAHLPVLVDHQHYSQLCQRHTRSPKRFWCPGGRAQDSQAPSAAPINNCPHPGRQRHAAHAHPQPYWRMLPLQ